MVSSEVVDSEVDVDSLSDSVDEDVSVVDVDYYSVSSVEEEVDSFEDSVSVDDEDSLAV